MRALLPHPVEHGDVDLHRHYAADWADRGGLRVNFVSSLDGAATADGLSRGLQTPGDNQVFAALRDLADVILVGAGTARAEGYRPSRPGPRRRELRRAHGFAECPPIAVVSRSLRLDPASPLFAAAESGPRTIVVTCAAADAEARTALATTVDLVVCGEHEVDLAAACAELERRGLTRILSEGGPTLFGDLVRADLVDELCLSVSPVLAGPGPSRIVDGAPWGAALPAFRLAGLLEEDGALFGRYRRT